MSNPDELSALIDGAREYKPPLDINVDSPLPNLSIWTADRYIGPVPEREYLIDGILPLGVPVMLAAAGGMGKSMLTLKMALMVGTSDLSPSSSQAAEILGGKVVRSGTVVLLTAEDDHKELHRRIAVLDPEQRRSLRPQRLRVVPLCDAGGAFSLVELDHGKPSLTEKANELARQLQLIEDLTLVVLDPLQSFVAGDTKASEVAQVLCSYLTRLAAVTGATILVTHHFRKDERISNGGSARDAIRGSTGLVDGVRLVYALWPATSDEAKRVSSDMGMRENTQIVAGAIVKANCPADFRTQYYRRSENGLLINLNTNDQDRRLLLLLEHAIAQAAQSTPFKKTGDRGVFTQKFHLPEPLPGFTRNRLERMVETLICESRIISLTSGSTSLRGSLDVPNGPLAMAAS